MLIPAKKASTRATAVPQIMPNITPLLKVLRTINIPTGPSGIGSINPMISALTKRINIANIKTFERRMPNEGLPVFVSVDIQDLQENSFF